MLFSILGDLGGIVALRGSTIPADSHCAGQQFLREHQRISS
jgi:hypothetical protein